MSATLAIASSGLQVQVNRLAASANNLANSASAGAVADRTGTVPSGQPTAYQPTEAYSVATGAGAVTGYRTLSPGTQLQYQPDSKLANSDGLVAVPNVDESQEATTRLSASRAYEANLAVIKTSDQMFRSVFKTSA